jgi:DNA-binding GntR family transcriptional regulator
MTAADFAVRRDPPLSAKVGERIRQMLAAQVFEPGDRLVEEEIARRLSVSRTPVREALFRLEQAGLVEQRDGGFHVPRLSLRDVQEIFQIRRLLEPQAVADIAATATDEDLRTLQDARDRLLAAATVEEATAANIAFRSVWLSRITNRRMQDMLVRFDDQVVLVRRATLVEPAARQAARAGVQALVAAIEAGDGNAARRVMEGFIDAALAWFERAVTQADSCHVEEADPT